MAMLRSFGSRPVTVSPPTRTSPLLGRSSPTISLSSVDLPQPDGPTSTNSSPSPMVRCVGFSASVPSGKRLATPSRMMSDMGAAEV